MKRTLVGVGLGLVLLVPGVAFAQSGDVETKFIDFNDLVIDGEFKKPTGLVNTKRGEARFQTLLSLRRSFMNEVGEAAEESTLK